MKIRKGDTIMVIAGKEKGKTGRVLVADQRTGRVLVEKLNMVKRHQKPNAERKQGGIVEKEAPLAISKVMFYDEKAGKPTRIGYRVLADGEKVRFAKRSGETIPAVTK